MAARGNDDNARVLLLPTYCLSEFIPPGNFSSRILSLRELKKGRSVGRAIALPLRLVWRLQLTPSSSSAPAHSRIPSHLASTSSDEGGVT